MALKRAAVDYRAGTSWACQPKKIPDLFGQKIHIGNFLCQCQNVKTLFKKLGAVQDHRIASSIICTCLKAMTVLLYYLSSLNTTVTGEASSCNSQFCYYISFTTIVVIVLFKYIRSNVKHTVQLLLSIINYFFLKISRWMMWLSSLLTVVYIVTDSSSADNFITGLATQWIWIQTITSNLKYWLSALSWWAGTFLVMLCQACKAIIFMSCLIQRLGWMVNGWISAMLQYHSK